MKFSNHRYATSDGLRIDLTLHHPEHGDIPFTLSQRDYPEMWEEVVEAEPAPYTPPPEQVLAWQVRDERDARLARDVDPLVTNPLRWADLSEARKEEVAAYRRALLAVPEQPGFPHAVEWPVLGGT